MKNEPKVTSFLDDEERELAEAIDSNEYSIGTSYLTEEKKEEIKKIAQATINEERSKITIRLPNTDLARLKAKALREGLPYQTLINSILHKAVSN